MIRRSLDVMAKGHYQSTGVLLNRLAIAALLCVATSIILLWKSNPVESLAFKKAFIKEWLKNEAEADFPNGNGAQIVQPFPLRNLGYQCKGRDIYVLDYAELKVLSGGELHTGDWGNAGSGGTLVEVYLYNDATKKFTKAFGEVVIEFIGVDESTPTSSDCPPLKVILHGSYFGRVGNDYGEGYLNYNNRKATYEFATVD